MIKQRIENLKEDLRGELYLNLDKYLAEEKPGRFTANYLGMRLDSLFQPVIDAATGFVVGYEALLRPTVGGLAVVPPEMAFRYAESYGKLVKFDRLCRTLHLVNYLSLARSSSLLFVNVHPKLLVNVDSHGRVFEQILQQYSVPTHKVVIEIQESAISNDAILRKAIDNYRDAGYRIAIDHFGRRGTEFGRLWRIAPDFVKSDTTVIHEITANLKLRRTFQKLVEMIRDTGAEPVVQGIENGQQREFLLALGARYHQGYWFEKPTAVGEWDEDSQ